MDSFSPETNKTREQINRFFKVLEEEIKGQQRIPYPTKVPLKNKRKIYSLTGYG